MGLRRPTADDLLEAAALNNLDPTAEEIDVYLSMIPEFFEALEALDQMPIEEPVVKGAVRDPGIRPSSKEDPLNAIVRRCSVKGPSSGKLDGIRVGLKDSVSVAGVPMTLGSRVISGYVSDIDATVTRRLLDEGAEIVAMLNMDDFAWSGSGGTSAYGPTFNPHNPEHLAGGSSAGSGAALYYDDIDHGPGRRPGRLNSHSGVLVWGGGIEADFRTGALHGYRWRRPHYRSHRAYGSHHRARWL